MLSRSAHSANLHKWSIWGEITEAWSERLVQLVILAALIGGLHQFFHIINGTLGDVFGKLVQ